MEHNHHHHQNDFDLFDVSATAPTIDEPLYINPQIHVVPKRVSDHLTYCIVCKKTRMWKKCKNCDTPICSWGHPLYNDMSDCNHVTFVRYDNESSDYCCIS